MEFLDVVPALVKLLVVFVLVVFLIRKGLSLGNTFLAGTLLLGFLFGLKPLGMLQSIIASMIYPKTVALAMMVSLILVLSNSMEETGHMGRLLGDFKGLIKNPRLNIVVFPAIIGLLPMPGGAVFSAPMVKELGLNSGYSPARLSAINYWFRHIWEYWWPMYPGILLITVLADINLLRLMLFMGPFSLVAIVAGYRLLKADITTEIDGDISHGKPLINPFVKGMIPIFIVIFAGLSMGILFAHLFPGLGNPREAGMIVALVMSILWVWRVNRFPASGIRGLLAKPQMLKMIYMIFAILMFKGMLEDSHAVEAITLELTMTGIPLVLIFALLPFLIGTATGITIAFVGSAFPILLPLVPTFDPAGDLLWYAMLGTVSGFVGVLVSPVHLCLIMSNEYFIAPMGLVYRHIWRPCLYVFGAGFVYFYLLRLVFL
jgi:uncharacterized protein